jgi:N4-(beta-N-acetylglucosaminyl)-L-asparaginase
VGETPIIGAGLYIDNDIGAAGATGHGEETAKLCASFLVAEKMREGMSPGEHIRSAVFVQLAFRDTRGIEEVHLVSD